MISARKMAARKLDKKIDVQNKDTEATMYLYGDIGGWFGIDSQEFVKEINAIDAGTIHLRIDSGGGDIFAARAMKTAIMQHKSKVIAHIDGLAASAASFLAMGADEIEITDGGFMMIHNALSFLDVFGYFNVQDIENLIEDFTKEKELHGKINETIANDYVKRTCKDLDTVLGWMEETKWFTSSEALENKFVDRVYEGDAVEGNYDLSIYANVPDRFKNGNNKTIDGEKCNVSKRDLESVLRDAGCSKNRAKDVVAKVFHDGRDDQNEIVNSDGRDDQNFDNKTIVPVDDKIKNIESAPEKQLVDPVVELMQRAKELKGTK